MESNSSVGVCLIDSGGLPGNFSLGLFDGSSSHFQSFALVAFDISLSAIVPSKIPKAFSSALRVEGFNVLYPLEWNCVAFNEHQTFSFSFDLKSLSCNVLLPVAGVVFALQITSDSLRTNS